MRCIAHPSAMCSMSELSCAWWEQLEGREKFVACRLWNLAKTSGSPQAGWRAPVLAKQRLNRVVHDVGSKAAAAWSGGSESCAPMGDSLAHPLGALALLLVAVERDAMADSSS